MKRIILARSAGFCFGVKRAISLANETASGVTGDKAGGDGPIQSLGPLIHNPQAVEELEGKGIRVVRSASEVSCGSVIIRSHGVMRPEHETLLSRGVRIVDATCPFVKKAQEHARSLSREGYAVIVVGDADHPEVRSIVSYIEPGVPVLTTLPEIGRSKGIRKAGIVAQTTQSFDQLMRFVSESLRRFPEVRVYNTICNATMLRQKEAVAVAGKVEVMIVVGGYNSANTRRLAEICREINPRTRHIETAQELPRELVAEVESVGVTAGASTPQWIIDDLVGRIRELWRGERIAVSFHK